MSWRSRFAVAVRVCSKLASVVGMVATVFSGPLHVSCFATNSLVCPKLVRVRRYRR
jgi:hypothetical protein